MLTEATTEYFETDLRAQANGGTNLWNIRGTHRAHDPIGKDTSDEMGVAMHNSGREPTIKELLDDPIAWLLMASGRLSPETVREHVRGAKRKLDGIAAQSRLHRHTSAIGCQTGQTKNLSSSGCP